MEIIDGRYFGSGEKNLFARIQGLGDPPVVIETGLGCLSIEWLEIAKKLSEKTTVICYDRAGYGESPKGPMPRSSRNIAAELYNMLVNSGMPGPYIFLSQGTGGLYTQHFAHMFPRETAGIIFADSMSVDMCDLDKVDAPVYQDNLSLDVRMENIKKLTELSDEEFEATVSGMLNGIYNAFPAEFQNAMMLYQTNKLFYKTILNEYEALKDSCDFIAKTDGFPNIPIKVMVRDFKVMIRSAVQIGLPEEEARLIEEKWLELSKSLLNLSSSSEFFVVEGSTGAMHISRPDALTAKTLELIDELRQ